MIFNSRHFILATWAFALTNALPLEPPQNPRELIQRAKSYAVVNVDGGSTVPPDPEPTTVVEATTEIETVKVTHATPTSTNKPAAPVNPTSVSSSKTSTSTSSSSTSPSTSCAPTSSSSASPPPSSTTTTTPSPESIFVTIIITETAGPTSYYDNGLWHTSYPVKTFEKVALATTTSLTSSVTLPTLEPSLGDSYNRTQNLGRRFAMP